jgi:hypothetical protein
MPGSLLGVPDLTYWDVMNDLRGLVLSELLRGDGRHTPHRSLY